jgi:exodeoxyribonuclease VII large subunit
MSYSATSTQRNTLTVTELNRATSQLLNEHLFSVLVEGEISNLSAPSSGHLYFSLKDSNAQVRCAMFKTQQRKLSFKPENGKQVIVKAQVSLYEPRGDFQLIIEHLEEAGDGALRRAFDLLKVKLSEEGLFSPATKQSIPALPGTIGIITSPSGAAIRDILTVLKRRFTAVPIIVYPVAVQGHNAKHEIAKAIALANEQQLCDVLILGRGGGSLEDLWAFNEELVARAIFASQIPIISAVGHETDITIADFVADLRAATPSAAAEHASPDQQEWLSKYSQINARLTELLQRQLSKKKETLSWLEKRLQQQHPGQKLLRNAQRLDEIELKLTQAIQIKIRHNNQVIAAKIATLWQYDPRIPINQYNQKQSYLYNRLLSFWLY